MPHLNEHGHLVGDYDWEPITLDTPPCHNPHHTGNQVVWCDRLDGWTWPDDHDCPPRATDAHGLNATSTSGQRPAPASSQGTHDGPPRRQDQP